MNKAALSGYTPDQKSATAVAYFPMEFAIDQALKIYAGGLGFLAGQYYTDLYN